MGIFPLNFFSTIYAYVKFREKFKEKEKVYYIRLGNYISLVTNGKKYFLFLLKKAWKLSDAWEEYAICEDGDRIIIVPHIEKIINISDRKIILEFIKDNTQIINGSEVKRFDKPKAQKINM